MKKKNVLILYTGGTIGMIKQGPGQPLRPIKIKSLTRTIPELKELNCSISLHAIKNPIDSSEATPDFWIEIAGIIEKKYSAFDGFVVLHGTDTMAYTASALSFMLENLSKPVILTGSQVPLGSIRNDARRNIISAIEIAASDKPVPEVCIFFSNCLYRGNRAEKFTSSKFDAFQSLNYPVLAEAGVTIQYNRQFIRPQKKNKRLVVHKKIEHGVLLFKLFPGIPFGILEKSLSQDGVRAIVLETYGSGNAPTHRAILSFLENAKKKNILLVNISQCSGGKVEMGKYATSEQFQKSGTLSGGDMTTEATITKLMILLARYRQLEKVKQQFLKNLSGERS